MTEKEDMFRVIYPDTMNLLLKPFDEVNGFLFFLLVYCYSNFVFLEMCSFLSKQGFLFVLSSLLIDLICGQTDLSEIECSLLVHICDLLRFCLEAHDLRFRSFALSGQYLVSALSALKCRVNFVLIGTDFYFFSSFFVFFSGGVG